jgi:hypothetical protein
MSDSLDHLAKRCESEPGVRPAARATQAGELERIAASAGVDTARDNRPGTGDGTPKKNAPLSRRLRKRARTSKMCYRNAWKVAVRLREEGEPAVYVEGLAVHAFSFEHAWVELGGEIIDVTLPDDDLAYFAGLRFADPVAALGEFGGLPSFTRFGYNGEESLDFSRARLEAAIYEERHRGTRGMRGYVKRLRQNVDRLSRKDACDGSG